MSDDEEIPPTSVRLDGDQLAEIKEIAAKERSSRNATIKRLVDEAIAARKARGESFPRPAPSADEAREPHVTGFPVVALAAAGSGREAQFADTGERVEVVNTLARIAQRKRYQFVRVVGDSMEPSFFDGDIVAVEPTTREKVKNRDVVYVRFNGDPQIKEIHLGDKGRRITLMPRNTRTHDPIPILEGDTLEVIAIVRDLAHRADAARKG